MSLGAVLGGGVCFRREVPCLGRALRVRTLVGWLAARLALSVRLSTRVAYIGGGWKGVYLCRYVTRVGNSADLPPPTPPASVIGPAPLPGAALLEAHGGGGGEFEPARIRTWPGGQTGPNGLHM